MVIGRNTGGTKEQFDNGIDLIGKEIGLRFTTIQELSNLLKDVATSDNKYSELVTRAHDVVMSLYRTDININNILRFYLKNL